METINTTTDNKNHQSQLSSFTTENNKTKQDNHNTTNDTNGAPSVSSSKVAASDGHCVSNGGCCGYSSLSTNCGDSCGPVDDFQFGEGSVETLTDCSRMLLEATQNVLAHGPDIMGLFSYGFPKGGSEDVKNTVAQFLTREYGDTVHSSNLIITSGSTQGFHLSLSVLMPASSPVFVVDPTFFRIHKLVSDDLKRTVVPVPTTDEGPIMEVFEELVASRAPPAGDSDGEGRLTGSHPFWAAAYVIPCFNNPRGTSYSEEICKQLVALARKYNLILISDDVYNLIYFPSLSPCVPRRLLAYDTCSDPGYRGGNVLSNGTFSKIFSPGVRLGWIEGPDVVMQVLLNCNITTSSGCFNHYTSKLMANIIRQGQMEQHLQTIRLAYEKRTLALYRALDDHLPSGCSYIKAKGGLFVWIQLRPDTDALEFADFALKNNKVRFVVGSRTSPTSGYKNCVRLSVTRYTNPESFCQAYKDFLQWKEGKLLQELSK